MTMRTIYDSDGNRLGQCDVTGRDPTTGTRYLAAIAAGVPEGAVFYRADDGDRWAFYAGSGGAEGAIHRRQLPPGVRAVAGGEPSVALVPVQRPAALTVEIALEAGEISDDAEVAPDADVVFDPSIAVGW